MSQNSVSPEPGIDKFEIHYRQQLSALIDGELPADEARFMLRRLQHDHELAGCIDRWQLCGAVLRQEVRVVASADFSGKVAAAIEAEAPALAVVADRQPRRHGWTRWGGGAALAASLAAVALFVARETVEAPAVPVPATATTIVAPLSEPAPAPAAPLNAPAQVTQPVVAGRVASVEPASAGTLVNPVPDNASVSERAAMAPSRANVVPIRSARTVAASPSPTGSRMVQPRRARSAPLVDTSADTAVATTNEASPSISDAVQVPAARPWPRRSLPQSSDFFNAGYSGSVQGSNAFGTLGSELPPQALFPPANDDAAPTSVSEPPN